METIGIVLLGALLVAFAAWALIAPTSLLAWAERFWRGPNRVAGVAGVRIVLGGYLIAVADSTPLPAVTTGLGLVFIAAGIAVVLMSRERIDRILDWWLERPTTIIQSASVVWVAFAGLLFYLGLTPA